MSKAVSRLASSRLAAMVLPRRGVLFQMRATVSRYTTLLESFAEHDATLYLACSVVRLSSSAQTFRIALFPLASYIVHT
jgi:hypothetical protein